ncbi:MAG: HAD-IIIA family hydrolase [Planctomycetes bacterium]|nr:HAD-IIIA family hydrolase [Planctomycetota bacterium]
MTRTVFLDRDGTLNAEVGFVRSPAQVQVLPGVREALHRLVRADCRLIVVTNQSGIARGLYGEVDLARVHAQLHAELDELPWAYLHCPHHPEGDHGYGGACECRKPGAGLLHQARELLGVPFEGAALIGDSARDLLMARGLPITTIYVHSGKPAPQELATMQAAAFAPDHEAADLPAAVDWLLRR